MAVEKFSINEALSSAWAVTKSNFLPLLGFGLLAGALMVVPQLLAGYTLKMIGKHEDILFTLLAMPIPFIMHVIADMGRVKIALDFLDNRKPDISSFFSPLPQFLNFIAATILFQIMVAIGLLFLIVPGIILALTFAFFPYFIIDQKCGPIEALTRSAAITSGAKWNLLGLAVLLFLICIVGLMLLVIGLIPAAIVSSLALAHTYRQLLACTDKAAVA